MASKLKSHKFNEVTLTYEQDKACEVARVGFMSASPFYSHYFLSEMVEVYTKDIKTLATDGRHVFINPEYMVGLKPSERVFALAHEVDHVINRDPQRMKHYMTEGHCRGVPYDHGQFNTAQDYRTNHGLMEQGVGTMNPSWLFDKRFGPNDLPEDIYKIIYEKQPEGDGGGDGGGKDPGGKGGRPNGSTARDQGKTPRGAKGDPVADQNGGGFDDVLPPPIDPVTGEEDVPTEGEFREAVARAAAAAKAMGNLPGNLAKRVEEILAPQVEWRDHVRMLMTGMFGAKGETWAKLDRRSAALYGLGMKLGSDNPFFLKPGRKGYGADTVIVARDTSGSIGDEEESAYMGEIGGILADVRPRRVILLDCDTRICQVQELYCLEEASDEKVRTTLGHGGTDLRKIFDWVRDNDHKPECLIVLTDCQTPWPNENPGYPTVVVATTDAASPAWAERVRLKV